MGKDFVFVRQNGFNLLEVYKKLENVEVTTASDVKYFDKKPHFINVEEIELGQDGTQESIIRLKSGGWFVVDKTISLNTINTTTTNRGG